MKDNIMKALLFSMLFAAFTLQANAQTTSRTKHAKSIAKAPLNKTQSSKENFSVLRNPSSTNIIIFYDNAEPNAFGVEITNESGQVIFHKSYTEPRATIIEEVDLKEAERGIYYIEIISPERTAMKKIILN